MLENGTSRGATLNLDELLYQIWITEKLTTKQLEDPHIKLINVSERQEWQEVSCMSPVTNSFWAQSESIEVADAIFYRRWEDASRHDVKYQDCVLQNLHDFPAARYFTVKKTLARARQRFN